MAASLALPIGYGAEIFGVIYGWMLVSVLFPFCPVYVLPVLGAVLHRKYPGAAVVLCGLGALGWGWLVYSGGFMIDAFLRDEQIFASGLVLGLAGSVSLLAGAILNARSVKARRSEAPCPLPGLQRLPPACRTQLPILLLSAFILSRR